MSYGQSFKRIVSTPFVLTLLFLSLSVFLSGISEGKKPNKQGGFKRAIRCDKLSYRNKIEEMFVLSNTLYASIGFPEGCVLSSVLLILYTDECRNSRDNCHVICQV